MRHTTNYDTLCQRLSAANTQLALTNLEASVTRLFNAGCISVSELLLIDVAIMEKAASI